MGSTQSSSSRPYVSQDELIRRANYNYAYRVRNYNYAYNGPYYEYIEYCQAQYQLECMPEEVRYGSGYRGPRVSF